MKQGRSSTVSAILSELGANASAGDRDQLWRVVYAELREIAERLVRNESPSATLQPTALVHDAYLRLMGSVDSFESRAHFFGAAARAMRQLLIDRARRRDRRGEAERIDLEVASEVGGTPRSCEIDALLSALDELEEADERVAEVIMLRFFAGMDVKEIAVALELSPATVKRDWAFGRAWLAKRLVERESDEG